MKGKDRDGDLLEYIWESMQRVEQYRREGSGPMAQDAVLRRLETLADAAGQLSEDVKVRHPNVPWPRIVAFRNVLAHGYINVQQAAIDRILDFYLPELKTVIDQERTRFGL
jgi:uncharacterized protein with HEPN domain